MAGNKMDEMDEIPRYGQRPDGKANTIALHHPHFSSTSDTLCFCCSPQLPALHVSCGSGSAVGHS